MDKEQLAPHPNVVSTRFSDTSAALLHLETKRYYTLNETGLRIWEKLEEGMDSALIAAALHDEFAVTVADAEAHVAKFKAALSQEGILTPRSSKVSQPVA